MQATWYFDFISPFSYLQLAHLEHLPVDVDLTPAPVLFAGLLAHHGNLGPAEVPAKRRHTYRFCQWYATHHGLEFRMPPAHPFNPIGALRLAVALGSDLATVREMFRFVFAEGQRPDTEDGFDALAGRLHLSADDARARTQAAQVKQALRSNTEAAANRGVFGVPTLCVNDETFWGVDATQMFIDYVRDPAGFDNAEMQRVSSLPVGVERPR